MPNYLSKSVTPNIAIICLIAIVSFGFMYVSREFTSSILQQLVQVFSLSIILNITAINFVAYLVGIILGGVLLDSMGIRYPLFIGFIINIIGMILFGVGESPYLIYLSKIALGFSEALIILSLLKLTSSILPKKLFPIVSGIFIALSNSQIFLHVFLGRVGMAQNWSQVSYVLGFISVVLLCLFYITLKNNPQDTAVFSGFQKTEIKKLFNNKNIWIIAIIYFLTSTSILFLSLFGHLFLVNNAHFSEVESAQAILWIVAGMVFGAPTLSFFSQLIYNRKHVLLICLFLLSLIMSLVIFYTPNFAIVCKLMFLFGFLLGGCISIFYITVNDITDDNNAGTAFSFLILSSILGGIFYQVLIGKIYTLSSDWQIALSAVPLTLIIATLTTLFLTDLNQQNRAASRLHPLEYLMTGWAGKFSLGRSYWVIYFWGNLAYTFLVVSLILLIFSIIPGLYPVTVFDNQSLFSLTMNILALPCILATGFAVWKCANNYEWWAGWKYVAIALVIIGCFNTLLNVFNSVIHYASI